MKLLSFQINHYGPLRETPRIHLNTFNLFWGHNEDGKTLTLEALVTLLLGKEVRRIDRQFARVEELPLGFVEVQLKEHSRKRYECKQSIADDLKIPPVLFLNLFVVRNSDLIIQEDERFYGTVTEQLTHSRLSRIERLKHLALQKAQLTPKGDQLRNTAENHKLRERFQNALELVKQIETLEATAKTEGWPELTQRIVETRQRLQHLKREIQLMEVAQKRQMLEEGEQLLHQWQKVDEQLKELVNITPEVSQQWQAIQTRIEQLETDQNELAQNIEKLETLLHHERQELEILQAEVDQQRQVREQLQQDFLPAEKQIAALQETVIARRSWRNLFYFLLGSTFFSLILALYFTLQGENHLAPIFFYILLGLLFAESLIYGLLVIRPTQQLKRLEHQLIQKALALGLSGQSESEVRQRVHQFLQQLSTREKRLENRRAQVQAKEQQLQHYQNIRQKKQEEYHQERSHLSRLQHQLDVATLMELNQRLKNKNQLERRRAELTARLQQLLDTPTGSLPQWKQALEILIPFREAAPGMTYDERQLTQYRQEKTQLEEALTALNEQLQTVHNTLQEIERKARNILIEMETPPICHSVFDLPSLRQQLQSFCQEVQQRIWLGQQLNIILTEALEEEQARISDLFGENSSVSQYFREITNGLYTAVRYDVQKNQLQVVQKGAHILFPEQLSGGTFDQLYFAIRIALAEKILAGEPGFLILDDPFIKADPQRLSVLMTLLLTLCEKGWQILYFSAKKEILSVLETAIQNGQVTRIHLPQPSYKTERA